MRLRLFLDLLHTSFHKYLIVMDSPCPQATETRLFLELSASSHKWGIRLSTYPTPAGQDPVKDGKFLCTLVLASCEIRQKEASLSVSIVLMQPDTTTNG